MVLSTSGTLVDVVKLPFATRARSRTNWSVTTEQSRSESFPASEPNGFHRFGGSTDHRVPYHNTCLSSQVTGIVKWHC